MKNAILSKVLAVATLPALLFAAAGVTAVGSLTVGPGAAIAEASPVRNSRFSTASAPQAARGHIATWRIRLTANGHPVANCPVAVTWQSNIRSATALPSVRTDANGYATISFRVPTNVREDNVILTAISGGGPFTAVISQRVAITR